MIPLFVTIRFLDIIDILLVAFLLYQLYLLLKDTAAIRIFVGIFAIYVLWLLVKAMKMELLSSILGQVIGVGVIAIIIVFQQEIRRFLMLLGTRYFNRKKFKLNTLFQTEEIDEETVKEISESLVKMSETLTGALIVISKDEDLVSISKTGTYLNANISSELIRNIFFKNSPLHDGALLINNNKIIAAACVLPTTERGDLPKHYGLRHRAALGMSENTNTIILVVSEETGEISYCVNGNIRPLEGTINIQQIINDWIN